MKRILSYVSLLVSVNNVNGQITLPIVKANFGIEADVSSNFYNNAQQPAVDDWFSNGYAGTGQAVIDTTGAAAIVAGYTTNPATRLLSFSRLMRQAPFSLVNNRLVLDAIFHRDFHGNDSTVFASGSNKNGMSPVAWTCPVSQGIPDKNDILDAFTHVRRAGPNLTDSLWMFSGIAIENTTGSRYFDFELYQTDIAYDRPTRTFLNYGPDAGHTSWKFNAAGNIISPGDIIFTAEFGSSGLTLIQARVWIKKTDLAITPTAFNWGGQFDGDGSGAVYGYANILPKTTGAFYTGIQSTVATTWAGPFMLIREDNSMVPGYNAKQFMEFSVNLTKLGIDPGNFSNNPCGTPFRRVLIKTRASTSFTAELKDFIAPFRMFDYTKVDADLFLKYYCEVMPVVNINVTNPISTSIYTWTTSDGHIVGATNGSTIQVDAPGTYYVTQQLHASCPVYARDSVPIFFDSVCLVLNLDIKNFDARKRLEAGAELSWKVNNNELADHFELEYSFDNKGFHPLSSIPANNRRGIAAYTAYSSFPNALAPVIYYRLKVVGKNTIVKYSQTVKLGTGKLMHDKAFVYPNPVNGIAWISINLNRAMDADVSILDNAGRLLWSKRIAFKKGDNIASFDELVKQPPGVYFVRIKTADQQTIQKVVLVQ